MSKARTCASQVRDATGGRGVDLVLDFTGGPEIGSHLAALAYRGRLVLVGLVGGRKAEVDLGLDPEPAAEDRSAPCCAPGRGRRRRASTADFAAFALPRLRDGRLRPVVDRTFPLERAAEAYKALERGGVFGKVILSMA